MRAFALGALLLSMGLGLSSCDDGGGPGGGGGFPTLTPYYASDYMTSYTEVADCRLSGPHPNYMRVHIYPTAQAAFYNDRSARQGQEFPEGTIIVKTEYGQLDCGGSPWRITAMRKGAAGTAPSSGDWEWQEFDFRTESERQGPGLSDCVSCHTNACNGPTYDYTCVEP